MQTVYNNNHTRKKNAASCILCVDEEVKEILTKHSYYLLHMCRFNVAKLVKSVDHSPKVHHNAKTADFYIYRLLIH